MTVGRGMSKLIHLDVHRITHRLPPIQLGLTLTSAISSATLPATSRTMSHMSFRWKGFSPIQRLISLQHAGYLEKGLNFVTLPASNCWRKRGSWDQNNRMSVMLKRIIAIRSSPRPNAHPTRSFGTARPQVSEDSNPNMIRTNQSE